MILSTIQQRGSVPFPAFTSERVYMREFTKAGGLPSDLRRWQGTVDAMLDGIDTPGPIFLMVDQGFVRAGQPQRRPGVHVDGYWNPKLYAHGHGGHGESPAHPGHDGRGRHSGSGPGREALILATNVLGSCAYAGHYEGKPGPGGDCSHIDISKLDRVDLTPGTAWAGHSLHMLHESMPVEKSVLRTLVRLNVPGWAP